MNNLSKHIENLKEYIRIDKQNIEYTGDFGEFCKAHVEDIEAVLERIEYLENTIVKIIDIVSNKSKIYELQSKLVAGTNFDIKIKAETLQGVLEEINDEVDQWK